AILSDRAQHAYWLMKTQDRQSLVCQPLRRLARKDSAVRVSLSSNHNVKEPVGVRPLATLPNPRWKQIPHLESTTAAASPETNSGLAPLLSEDRAVAYSPAGSGNDPREAFI